MVDVAAVSGGSAVVTLLGQGNGELQHTVDIAAGGKSPSGIALGDFNGDGILDFAVSNYDSGDVSVLNGNGKGGFQVAGKFAVGNDPAWIGAADFNGDGILDLVTVNSSGTASVLLGNGKGSFQLEATLSTNFNPYTAVLGDFNNDGHVDLAVGYYEFGGIVSIFLGNGDGTFQPKYDFNFTGETSSLAVADLNHDGNLDLVTFGPGIVGLGGNVLSVLLGSGDGNFTVSQQFTPLDVAQVVAVGDFNLDGSVDVVAAGAGFAGTGSAVVFLNYGDGTLQQMATYQTLDRPGGFAVADWNGDGFPDMAIACSDANAVWILPGVGQGAFGSGIGFLAGPYPDWLVTADFNGDQKLDLVVANGGGSGLAVLTNTSR